MDFNLEGKILRGSLFLKFILQKRYQRFFYYFNFRNKPSLDGILTQKWKVDLKRVSFKIIYKMLPTFVLLFLFQISNRNKVYLHINLDSAWRSNILSNIMMNCALTLDIIFHYSTIATCREIHFPDSEFYLDWQIFKPDPTNYESG